MQMNPHKGLVRFISQHNSTKSVFLTDIFSCDRLDVLVCPVYDKRKMSLFYFLSSSCLFWFRFKGTYITNTKATKVKKKKRGEENKQTKSNLISFIVFISF